MRTYQVTFLPNEQVVKVPEGTTIMRALEMAELEYDFLCGGRGRCGKCRVEVVPPTAVLDKVEQEILNERETEQGIRLACRSIINQDLKVRLLQSKRQEHQILISAVLSQVKLEPYLQKTYVQLNRPTLADQRSDWTRLKDELQRENPQLSQLRIPLDLLRRLPAVLRETGYHVTAVTDQHDVLLGVEVHDTSSTMLGLAVDIGTTTIVGYLFDLANGRELGVASTLNPQTAFGGDVITRITFSRQTGGLAKLQETVIRAINDLLQQVCAKAGVRQGDVYTVSIVGNTCMQHLFLGVTPEPVAAAPYAPVISEATIYDARDFKLEINETGRVCILPNIGGFVGSDMVAVLLSNEVEQSETVKLVIDIGTNGEIALGSKDRMVACSTAAGPAFEGAQISSGMRGAIGAIDHVRFSDRVRISVIGQGKPKGICGSGLLDAVAGLLELGIIEPGGRMLSPGQLNSDKAAPFQERIVKYEGTNAFVLVDETETADGRPILITQRDIRELQLAKGAMASGIQILLKVYGIEETDVSEVLLAGAFGNYLNPYSACRIGLIPLALEKCIKPVGNAAGTGAKLALLSHSEFRRATRIAEAVEHVELGAHPSFSAIFARSMYFPVV